MIEPFRSEFNARFTPERYERLLRLLDERTRTKIGFRVAETPCFFAPEMLDEMVSAGEELTRQLLGSPAYMQASRAAIPPAFDVPGQGSQPHFMTVDFGLVRGADGALEPKLVELQAFPSIFGYQTVAAEAYKEVFGLDERLTTFFGGMDETAYWDMLQRVIVADHAPENVVLLEIDPEHQKTLPDFHVHADRLGICVVDIARVVKRGARLFYREDRGGARLVPIERIYNRVIVDELVRKNVKPPFDYRDDLEVEWAGHPNWYFQISKFSIPYLDHPTVPAAVFLDDWFAGRGREKLPEDRTRWVLKPLYSFAGKGIAFAPSDADLDAVPAAERGNYLLQERVSFEPVIHTPEGLTQAEVRILYAWPDGGELTPMTSLVRMGRGLMMGVDQNRDRTWVGGSAGLYVPGVQSRKKQGKSATYVAEKPGYGEVKSSLGGQKGTGARPPARWTTVAVGEQKTDPVRTAVRFPLRLELLVSTGERTYKAVTRDVSANGLLFVADELPPIGAHVELRLTMPAAVMGGTDDVVLNCTGRIVRHATDGNEKLAGAVIDDYSLKAEQV